MDILHNNSLINEIVDKLFKHRRTDYSEFALGTSPDNPEHTLSLTAIDHEILRVPNQKYEKLYASLFKKNPHPEICILFMHGYGSNRLECANILRILPEQYALCAFDFSGSGKSEGDLITYGMKEKEDISMLYFT
jgi:pimeloyl-ACP methyl ester carboxylesterase